jgi:signal transduction histidine kinase
MTEEKKRVMSVATSPRSGIANHLLAAIPGEEFGRLLPHLERVGLARWEILHAADEPVRHVYFPDDGVITLISVMESGASVEVGVVGREGVIGLSSFLGSDTTPYQAVVLVAGSAVRVRADVFREEAGRGGALLAVLHRYTQALLTQAAQTSACNRLHHVHERVARCLLTVHDRVGGDGFRLTHELMANMLGVRRAGVTDAAVRLRGAGLIGYTRGSVKILDRGGLESVACECYRVIKEEFGRLPAAEPTGEETGAQRAWTSTGDTRGEGAGQAGGVLQMLRDINSRLIVGGIREQEVQEELEERVRERTAELQELTGRLLEEVKARGKAEREVKELLRRVISAQETERFCLARELHDHLGQQLVALKRNLETIKGQAWGREQLYGEVERMEAVVRQLDSDVDYLAWGLRPAALDRLGLAAALEQFTREWSGHARVAADFYAAGFEGVELPPEVGINLYRVAQEALNNVQKHAAARNVSVLLERRDGYALLIVEDDGEGFDYDAAGGDGGGMGLVNMRERASLIGGTLEIETSPGAGTSLYVRAPISPE